MYAGLGLSALVFTGHGILLYGWKIQNDRMSLDWMGLMAFLNLIGAAIYSARVKLIFRASINITNEKADSRTVVSSAV